MCGMQGRHISRLFQPRTTPQNVFSFCKLCSLQQQHPRMCSLSVNCVLLQGNALSYCAGALHQRAVPAEDNSVLVAARLAQVQGLRKGRRRPLPRFGSYPMRGSNQRPLLLSPSHCLERAARREGKKTPHRSRVVCLDSHPSLSED